MTSTIANKTLLRFLRTKTVLIFLVLSTIGCGYFESRAFRVAIEQKNCDIAKNLLLRSLKKDLNNQSAQYNLAQTFVCSGDLVSALKHIKILLKNNSAFQFELLYLQGFILGQTGEIDDALSSYQRALDIRSNIEIKQNMELLLKNSKSGKKGKKKKGKGKNSDKSQADKNADGEQKDPKRESKDPRSDSQSQQDPKNNKSQKMSQKQIEKIMKEIDSDEKKVRSQGLKIKSEKGGSSSEKNW